MTIAVSAIVSLTLSPMMGALFLRDERHANHGRLYMALERGFQWMIEHYTRGLDFVLRHQRATLMTFLATVATAVLLYLVIPKGFFPQQDTGVLAGVTDAPQDMSFDEMVTLERRLMKIIGDDPAVAGWASFVGGSQPLNNGFVFLGLKPRDERDATADQVIRRLRRKIAEVPGGTVFLQAAQDLNVGGRTSRTQYQYTLQDANIEELNEWAPRLLAELQKLPQLTDVASDQQSSSTKLSLVIDRDQAARFGIQPALIDNTLYDAFGQRQVTQYFTQLNSYHVVLEVLPSLLGQPGTLNKIYIKSPTTGQQVPLSAFTRFDTGHTTYLSINHQGQFPAVTLSFNLAPGAALGDAVDGHSESDCVDPYARFDLRHLPGHRPGLQVVAENASASDPGGVGGRIHHSRRALRELHSPADHSLDAALCRRRGAADADAVSLRPVDRGNDRHHPADRHRQEERHHDGRLRDPRGARTSIWTRRPPSARRACCASGPS